MDEAAKLRLPTAEQAGRLDDVFAEADFLLALRAEVAHRYGVYSHVADLEATLATAYGSVKTNPHRFDRPPTQLFPEKGAA